MRTILVIITLLILSSTSQAQKLVAVGDSITVKRGSYIDILEGQKFAKGKKASYNLFGQLRSALATNPTHVIVFVGINNPMSVYGCRDNWEVSLINDLKRMYAMIRKKKAKVIGITLLPAMKTWRNHYSLCPPILLRIPKSTNCCASIERRKRRNPNRIYDKMIQVNDFIMNNADIPIDNSDMWNKRGILKRYDADGIHLNNAAHRHLANKIRKKIQ